MSWQPSTSRWEDGAWAVGEEEEKKHTTGDRSRSPWRDHQPYQGQWKQQAQDPLRLPKPKEVAEEEGRRTNGLIAYTSPAGSDNGDLPDPWAREEQLSIQAEKELQRTHLRLIEMG